MDESREENGPVPVSKQILEGLDAIRESGYTNMLDRPTVMRLADQLGYPETAEWIRKHKADYAQGIFRGFQAEEKA